MVEALVFVHGKKVIHRDLKPSNIFMTKELNISIGDFGVSTVMNDARTRTRTTVGKEEGGRRSNPRDVECHPASALTAIFERQEP